MYELKKIGMVFTSKSVGSGPSSYEKRIYRGRGLTKAEKHCLTSSSVKVLVIMPELWDRNAILVCSGNNQLRAIMPGAIDCF